MQPRKPGQPHKGWKDSVRRAGRARRAIIKRREEALGSFTSARDMSRLIEGVARTLFDFHYISMRTPTEIIVHFIDGRKMTISIEAE